jgi:quercetin dioxygenase-like cupin family protein
MEIFKTEAFVQMANPTPEENYRLDLLIPEKGAKELGGFLVIIPPGGEMPYHYHEKRESLILLIKGEATETVEGKAHPVKAGEILFIRAGEKHKIVNRSDKDLRYLEFFTPIDQDFIETT